MDSLRPAWPARPAAAKLRRACVRAHSRSAADPSDPGLRPSAVGRSNHHEFACVAKAKSVRNKTEPWLVLTRSSLAGFNPIRDKRIGNESIAVPNTDSGIFLRGQHKSQVNIWCWPVGSGEVWGYRTDPAFSPGVHAGVTPQVRADRPIGQWNAFHIIMKGDRLTVTLNGQRVVDSDQLPGVPASQVSPKLTRVETF